MRKTLHIIVCIAACFVGCKNNNGATGSFLILDAEFAIDNEKAFDLSEIAKNLEFIALDDNNKEALIGSIGIIGESPDRLYIRAGGGYPVKVFDKSGKFLFTRGVIGRGHNELRYIHSIAVDYERDNIYIMGGGTSVVAYDTSGHIFAGNDSILHQQEIAYIDDRLVVMKYSNSTSAPGGRITLLEILSPDLKHEAGIDVVDKGSTRITTLSHDGMISIRYLNAGIMSNNGNSLLVKETLSDTVFHYSVSMGWEPAYRLDLGRHTLPNEAVGNNATVQWDERFYTFDKILEGERYILAGANNSDRESHLVLDRRDPSGGFSAVGSGGKPGLFLNGIKFTPCYIRDNRLVGYMQAIDIVDNADAITNPELKALAATLREDSNPVIVVATLKK